MEPTPEQINRFNKSVYEAAGLALTGLVSGPLYVDNLVANMTPNQKADGHLIAGYATLFRDLLVAEIGYERSIELLAAIEEQYRLKLIGDGSAP